MLTPSDAPAMYSAAMLIAAITYAVSTFAARYERGESGVDGSQRQRQPRCRQVVDVDAQEPVVLVARLPACT